MGSVRGSRAFRVAAVLGAVGLVLWGVLWLVTMRNGELPLGDRMWLTYPILGADFWSQSAYAAKVWLAGEDPYAARGHLLPYPPIVIRLFLWVDVLSPTEALRVWIVSMAALVVAGAVVAHRTRLALKLPAPPATLSVLAVAASYPVLFQLERGNCDLITVLTILLALPLLSRGGVARDLLAGSLLSLGPWVKFYPGLLGFGLVALRRPWALLGFAAGGAGIYLSMRVETNHALEVLSILMTRTRILSEAVPFYPPWSHSLSHAWLLIARDLSQVNGLGFVKKIPELPVAALLVVGAITPVCIRVLRRRPSPALTYPLLLWICAVASCAPIIANDYSLVFYPLCVVACADHRDGWTARIGILASLLTWQPFLIPLSPWIVLLSKLLGLGGVGVSLYRRAAEATPEPDLSMPLAATTRPLAGVDSFRV